MAFRQFAQQALLNDQLSGIKGDQIAPIAGLPNFRRVSGGGPPLIGPPPTIGGGPGYIGPPAFTGGGPPLIGPPPTTGGGPPLIGPPPTIGGGPGYIGPPDFTNGGPPLIGPPPTINPEDQAENQAAWQGLRDSLLSSGWFASNGAPPQHLIEAAMSGSPLMRQILESTPELMRRFFPYLNG